MSYIVQFQGNSLEVIDAGAECGDYFNTCLYNSIALITTYTAKGLIDAFSNIPFYETSAAELNGREKSNDKISGTWEIFNMATTLEICIHLYSQEYGYFKFDGGNQLTIGLYHMGAHFVPVVGGVIDLDIEQSRMGHREFAHVQKIACDGRLMSPQDIVNEQASLFCAWEIQTEEYAHRREDADDFDWQYAAQLEEYFQEERAAQQAAEFAEQERREQEERATQLLINDLLAQNEQERADAELAQLIDQGLEF